MDTLLAKVTNVFRSVFEDETLEISEITTAADILGWDSLMHVTLMINIEKAFGIRFRSAEVVRLKNVGDLLQLIHQHQAAKGRAAAA